MWNLDLSCRVATIGFLRSNQRKLFELSSMRPLFFISQICTDPFRHDHQERRVDHIHPITRGERAYWKRLLRMDYWDRRLGQVHRNESFGHTERSLHRIFRCISINLTEDLCLLVKRIHLHLHKLCLNSRNVLEILGLAKFLHERKSGRNILRRVAQKYSVQIRVTPRER